MKFWKTIYWIFIGFVVLIVLILISTFIPFTGSLKFLTVLSGSMEPTIKTGSVVVIKPADEYKVDDIITFGEMSRIKTPTTHRIKEIKQESGSPKYTTQGDANNGPDLKTISDKEIIGKVIFNVPYLGYAINAAKTPYGFIILIIIPAAFIIFDQIKDIFKEFKKIKNAKTKDVKTEEEN